MWTNSLNNFLVRTLWHSGLLLLLVLKIGANETTIVQQDQTGDVLIVQNGAFLQVSNASLKCQTDFDEDSLLLVSSFNGEKIENDLKAGGEEGKFECFQLDKVSNQILSYNFVQLTKENVYSNEVQMSFDEEKFLEEPIEGEEFNLNCQVNVLQNNNNTNGDIKWLYNGITLVEDSNIEIEKVSNFEQNLRIVKLSGQTNSGNWGCFYEDQIAKIGIYKEVLIRVKFKPRVEIISGSQLVLQPFQSFQLECQVNSYPSAKIQWTLNGQHFPNKEGNILKIKNATKIHEGKFLCSAENEIGTGEAEIAIKLDYEEPKIVSEFQDEILILENSAFQFSCKSSGKPEPLIRWIFNDEIVSTNSELEISNVSKRENEGTYECVADNSFGIDSSKFKLQIAAETEFLNGDYEANLNIHRGANLSLECSFKVDEHLKNDISIYWLVNDVAIDYESEILQISDFAVDSNFRCGVKTALDEISRSWSVSVVKIPEIRNFPEQILALESGSVNLNCEADGIPKPKVIWTDITAGVIFPQDTPTITVENIHQDRELKCEALNEHGAEEKMVRIFVVSRTAPKGPIVTVTQSDAGQELALSCQMVDIDPKLLPSARRSWFFNGESLNVEKDELKFNYLVKDHAGNYSCRIETELDSIDLHHVLKVNYEQPKIQSDITGLKVLVGKDIGPVECEIIGGIPKPEITWKFRKSPLKSNQLRITNASREHEGTYTCLAVNEYGNDVHHIHLEVLERAVFVESPSDNLVSTLETVRLECDFKSDERLRESTKVEWTKNDEKIPNQTGRTLKIDKVMKSDEGLYTCIVENELETLNRTSRLTVLGDGPSFISTEKDVRTLQGSNVTIACQANGLPLPKISWFKNGNELVGEHFRILTLGDLTISDVRLSDEGVYSCRAENVYGVISTRSVLEVIKKSVNSLVGNQKEIVKNVRENATLPCDITFDPRLREETSYSWLKDDRIIVFENQKKFKLSEQGSNDLKIANLTLDDKGMYECLVKTPYEVQRSKIMLQVSGEAPKIVTNLKTVMLHDKEDLELKCLVRGVPKPDISWLFNGEELKQDYVQYLPTASEEFRESRVLIRMVSKANEGVYQCEANNTYGSGVAKFAKVVVITRTEVNIVAKGDGDRLIQVHAGEILKIPCNFVNDPLNRVTNIVWTKDGKQILIGPNDRIDFGMDGSITITDVQRRHEGKYRCNVTTVLDVASDWVKLDVTVNAPVITSSSDNQFMFAGDSLVLMCKANGIPEPTLSWLINRTRSNHEGSEFTITNAISSDSGDYVCIAKNEYGETRKNMAVRVISLPNLEPEIKTRIGSEVTIPCVAQDSSFLKVSWTFNAKIISDFEKSNSKLLENGALKIVNVTDENEGLYSCQVAMNGRKKILQTFVSLKPNIITSPGLDLTVREGENATLACDVFQGLEAKILWKFEADYLMQSSSQFIKKGTLYLTHLKEKDSGTYTCIAVTSLGQDSITFNLKVEKKFLSLVECSTPDNPPDILDVRTVSNSSVKVIWNVSEEFRGISKSCLAGLKIAWWTNKTRSVYREKLISLSDQSFVIRKIDPSLGYYVHLILVGQQNVQKVGQTFSFVWNPDHQFDSLMSSSGFDSAQKTLSILILVSAIVVAIIIFLALFILVRKFFCKKKLPTAETQNQKGGFESQGLWINRHHHMVGSNEYLKRDSDFINDEESNNGGSATPGVLPQWPEPDPEQPEESQLFITKPETGISNRNSVLSHNRKSISSSWSSLFNQISGCSNEQQDVSSVSFRNNVRSQRSQANS